MIIKDVMDIKVTEIAKFPRYADGNGWRRGHKPPIKIPICLGYVSYTILLPQCEALMPVRYPR